MLALAASMRRGCRGLHCSAHLTQAELEIDGVPGRCAVDCCRCFVASLLMPRSILNRTPHPSKLEIGGGRSRRSLPFASESLGAAGLVALVEDNAIAARRGRRVPREALAARDWPPGQRPHSTARPLGLRLRQHARFAPK